MSRGRGRGGRRGRGGGGDGRGGRGRGGWGRGRGPFRGHGGRAHWGNPRPWVVHNGFGEQAMEESEYFFENGLRKVKPYYFTFSTHAKGRWIGRTILDVYSEEFLQLKREEYKRFIEQGKVQVNGKVVSPEYIVKDSDFIHHTMHRHENPVSDHPIEIIEVTDDVVVVNKPSSIPVHPCGSYRHNSVVFVLGHEHKLYNLRTIYRLDRMTSGVLVLARTQQRTLQLETQMIQKKVLKEYVCRVVGEFPSERVECTESLIYLSPKLGIHRVCAEDEGKECMTIFERMSFNGKTSVVRCKPVTGRTHQIRVHLQYLGHPIVNDPIYNCEAFGPNRGKGGEYGKSLEQLVEDIKEAHSRNKFKIDFSEIVNQPDHADDHKSTSKNGEYWTDSSSVDTGMKREHDDGDKTGQPAEKKMKVDPDQSSVDGATGAGKEGQCSECLVQYRDPEPEDLVMYLHAFKYEGPDWEYGTDMPEWAKRDWKDPSGVAS